jgi:type II secretory pathway pseudopilin PulG
MRIGHRHPSPRSSEGAVLIAVLIVVTVFAIIAVAVSSYAFTSSRRANLTRERTDRVAAANAGVREAINRFRENPRLCGVSGGASSFVRQINGIDVLVSCSFLAGQSAGIGGWALVTTDSSTVSFDTQGNAGDRKLITGNVYLSGIDPSAELDVKNGDVLRYDNGTPGSCNLNSPAVQFDPTGYVYSCVTDPWTAYIPPSLDPNNLLPPAFSDTGWVTHNPAAPVGDPTNLISVVTVAGREWTIYKPGRYDIPLTLTKAGPGGCIASPTACDHQYFESGEYYFTEPITTDSDIVVIGGKKAIAENVRVPAVKALIDAGAVPADSAPNGSGVTWLFGDNASINAGKANVELFVRRDAQLEGWSIVAVKRAAVAAPAVSWTNAIDTGYPTVVQVDPGNQKNLSVHGRVWVPDQRLNIDNGSNDSVINFLYGVVAGRFNLYQTSASATGVEISVPTLDNSRRLRIDALAGNVDATAVIQIANDADASTAINSWVVGQP